MPRSAKDLTKRELDSLRRQATADPSLAITRADGRQRGLYARVRGGRVEFWFRVRRPGGKRAMKRIGTYGRDITLDQARKIAQDWWAIRAGRRDVVQVLEERDQKAKTVADVVADYLEDFQLKSLPGGKRKRSSYVEAERLLTKHVLPKLGGVPVRSLTKEQVRRVHSSLSATPGAADRMLTALHAALAFGSLDGPNPARSSKRGRGGIERNGQQTKRRRLEDHELRGLGATLNEAATRGSVEHDGKRRAVHPSVVLTIRWLALTGMRRGELLGSPHAERRGKVDGLRWRDVDFRNGVVTLRDSKTGAQVRVLGKAAVELLREAMPEDAHADDCVCPGPSDRRTPYRAINAARRLVWRAAGIPLERGCDLHSLRHTFASIGAHVHHGRFVGMVAPLLGHGHQVKRITERYIESDEEKLQDAADAIAGEIAGILGLGESADVLAFPGR